jgi:hypothetical protein
VNPSNVRVGMPLLKDSRSDDRAIVSANLFQLEIVPGPIVLLLELKILHTLIELLEDWSMPEAFVVNFWGRNCIVERNHAPYRYWL